MLKQSVLHNVLTAALSKGGDFAEVFVEDRFNTAIEMVKGAVEKTMSGRDFGVGIRIFQGHNSVYTYTSNAEQDNLIKLAIDASIALNTETRVGTHNLDLVLADHQWSHQPQVEPASVATAQKVELMRRGHNAANKYDKSISQVLVNYLDYTQKVQIANSDGLLITDSRTRTRATISAIAEVDGRMQTGYMSKGASKGFELYEQFDFADVGQEAARVAVTMLHAANAPSGKMPVVIENKFGGVIFHEACGHGLEATSVAKGNSVFAGKMGQQVASPEVTAVDNGTELHGWGSANIDDEGTPTQNNSLIEKGILKGYLVDKLNTRRMQMAANGCARRQSYKFAPTSRMSNTYILNGTAKFNDMVSSIDNGLYAKYLGGGSVNTATGEFNFSVQEAYLIENGKITTPVKGATLVGTGIDVLNKIEMVSDNFASSQGMCGSISGGVPAGIGQPALKVSEMTVGGRDA